MWRKIIEIKKWTSPRYKRQYIKNKFKEKNEKVTNFHEKQNTGDKSSYPKWKICIRINDIQKRIFFSNEDQWGKEMYTLLYTFKDENDNQVLLG